MTHDQMLAALEAQSRLLDAEPAEMARWLERLSSFSSEFLREVPGTPAFRALTGPVPVDRALPEGPSDIGTVLAEYRSAALVSGMHPVSGRFFGYVPGGGVPSAAVGDFVASLRKALDRISG